MTLREWAATLGECERGVITLERERSACLRRNLRVRLRAHLGARAGARASARVVLYGNARVWPWVAKLR